MKEQTVLTLPQRLLHITGHRARFFSLLIPVFLFFFLGASAEEAVSASELTAGQDNATAEEEYDYSNIDSVPTSGPDTDPVMNEAVDFRENPEENQDYPGAANLDESINKAIEEAKLKLEENGVHEIEARQPIPPASYGDHLPEVSEDPRAHGSYWPIMFNEGMKPLGEAYEAMGRPFRGEEPGDPRTPEGQELLKEAGIAYQNPENYAEAYEMASRVLRIEPDNRQALHLQKKIRDDLETSFKDLVPQTHEYTPPEGVLAYKVAMSDGTLSKDEAVEIALKNSIMLESLRRQVESSKRKLLEAKRATFPTLDAEVSVNGGSVAGDAYTGEAFKLNMSQPIFYGGELVFTIRQAEANVESDRLKYEQERQSTIHKVGEAYRAVASADYNSAFQTALLSELQEHVDRIKKAYEEKVASEIEKLEVESIFNQSVFQKESAMNTLKSAYLNLYQLLGLDIAEQAPVDLSLVFIPFEVDIKALVSDVVRGNYDIRIKRSAAEGAYYGVKVYDAKKLPKVDMRGSLGLTGEVKTGGDNATDGPFGSSPDLEDEKFIGINVSVPWGAHSVDYSYQRRFFGPTVLSLTGSDDYKHSWKFNWMDKLADLTDEEKAVADYLKAQAELRKERLEQTVEGRSAYYDYQNALLQIETSTSKIRFREKQVAILKHTTSMEESKVSQLLGEMVSLAEDKYARVSAIGSAKDALSKMDYLTGKEGFYERQS